MSEKLGLLVFSILLCVAVFGIIAIPMSAMPKYRVWSQEMRGKADLAEAQWNRQIQIQEAEANLESEKLNAQSEVERAKGMAEAIGIENGQLTDRYIQYLWVRNMKGDNNLIYIPTEANLPILEAGRAN